MKIELEVSEKYEGTTSPWWVIIDPSQSLYTGTEACYKIASMITGPFFSREEAQYFLTRTRYNFGKNPVVYCHSGCYSKQYDRAYRDSESRRPK